MILHIDLALGGVERSQGRNAKAEKSSRVKMVERDGGGRAEGRRGGGMRCIVAKRYQLISSLAKSSLQYVRLLAMKIIFKYPR